jgi:hypothetical protein
VPQKLRHQPHVHGPNQSELPPLKIVVVYDGMTDLIRVDEIWPRLIARFKDEIQIASCAWNFALLHDPRLRERAALHTAEADLIVFSASGRSKLPGHIKNWVDTWLPWKKGRRDALVAVLGREPLGRGVALPLRNYLQHTAEQSGMDFFCSAGL